jgi:hypothetical protein
MEECGPCPVFASYTLAFALQLRKKHGKTSVRVVVIIPVVSTMWIRTQQVQSSLQSLSSCGSHLTENKITTICSSEGYSYSKVWKQQSYRTAETFQNEFAPSHKCVLCVCVCVFVLMAFSARTLRWTFSLWLGIVVECCHIIFTVVIGTDSQSTLKPTYFSKKV